MQASFETVVTIQVNRFFAFTESNVLPIIRNTFFSSDLEYLSWQLVIQITLGKSFANLVLLRRSSKNSTGYLQLRNTLGTCLCLTKNASMQHATLTDTRGYGPA